MMLSSPVSAAADPPETGASTMARPQASTRVRELFGARDIDGRTIDQDHSGRSGRQNDLVICGQYMLAFGQHGDYGIAIGNRFSRRRYGRPACVGKSSAGVGVDIDSPYIMSEIQRAFGHRKAHDAEPDDNYAEGPVLVGFHGVSIYHCQRVVPVKKMRLEARIFQLINPG